MASLALTDRQRTELNHAIIDYLTAQGDKFLSTIDQFKNDAAISPTENIELGKGLLEKKWTSVIRLQKRVMELETKLEQLQQQRTFGAPTSDTTSVAAPTATPALGESKLLPRPPARYTLSGHRAAVTVVSCHPIYSIIASGSEDTTIRIWDSETGSYEKTLKGHTGSITGLAFDSKGLFLASCSQDMSAKLWDMNTNTCVKTLKGHDHTISCISFFSNNERLITCSRDQTIKLWEVGTGYCVRTLANGHSDWIKTFSISLDNAYLASAGNDQVIQIWQIATGNVVQTLRGHEHVIETVCYGKKPLDINALVTKAGLKESSSSVSTSESSNEATAGAASTDANDFSYLVSGSRDRSVKLWDPLKNVCLMTFTCHENWVRNVLFHPSNKFIISCSDDKSIRVLDIKEGRCMRTIADAHTHFVATIAMSKQYPVLISGSVDRNVSVWNCS